MKDMQKTWKRMTITELVRDRILQYAASVVLKNVSIGGPDLLVCGNVQWHVNDDRDPHDLLPLLLPIKTSPALFIMFAKTDHLFGSVQPPTKLGSTQLTREHMGDREVGSWGCPGKTGRWLAEPDLSWQTWWTLPGMSLCGERGGEGGHGGLYHYVSVLVHGHPHQLHLLTHSIIFYNTTEVDYCKIRSLTC